MNYFYENRKSVLKDLKDFSSVLLFAGKPPIKIGDQLYPFTPNRNFYYFTGIDKEKVIYLAIKANNIIEEFLFIERYDELKAKWEGASISIEDAIELSNIQNIKFLDEFYQTFSALFFRHCINNLYLDLENRYFAPNAPAFDFAKDFKKNYPFANMINIYPIIASFRLIKKDYEISALKKAINITKDGIYAMLKNAKQGMYEYELEAFFDFELKKNNVKHKAFDTILASSKNAAILHYIDNNCKIEDNSLVLLDLGATYSYYSADISRTFPINGKFSDRQKLFYNIVLKGQQLVIDFIKPNVVLKELNQVLIAYYTKELIKIGLIKEDKELSKYFYHNVSHFLGLEAHDICINMQETVLKEGMVVTVEPGLYIKEENIGIRIEDDILVTKNGCENLSKDIIKTVEEIEAFMQK